MFSSKKIFFLFFFVGCSPQNLTSEIMNTVVQESITLDHPDVFLWEYYLKIYPDLSQAGINSLETARAHWLNAGAKEGRKAHPYFLYWNINRIIQT